MYIVNIMYADILAMQGVVIAKEPETDDSIEGIAQSNSAMSSITSSSQQRLDLT